MASKINDDQATARRRKNKLEDVKVPLREQMPKALMAKLKKDNIGQKVVDLWQMGNASRATWLERQDELLHDLDDLEIRGTYGPFAGSSNLHIPMPLIICKAMHARLLQALIGPDGLVHTKPRNESSKEKVQAVQDTMTYALKDWANNEEGVEAEVTDWVWDFVTQGVGIIKTRWEKRYERFFDIEEELSIKSETIADPVTGLEIVVQGPQIEEIAVKRQLKVEDGPVIERKPVNKIVLIGGKGNTQNAQVIEEDFLNASALWTLVDQGLFDKSAVKAVIESGGDSKTGDQTAQIQQSRDHNAGGAGLDRAEEQLEYKIYEAYIKVDVDGSGIDTQVVVWVHPRTREILRATFLRRISPDGKIPFAKADFLRRPDQDYGIGLLEMMHALSVEMDAMHNMRIDFGLISTMPFGFYRPTSSIKPETIRLEPGALIPVDNPQQDVFFPNLGNRTAFGFAEEAAIQSMIERMTGINDLSLGVLSSTQGAARTATGVKGLQAESNINLDPPLRNLRRAWRQVLRQVYNQVRMKSPEGLSFAVTGEDGFDRFLTLPDPISDLQGKFDFDISPSSADSNPQMMQQKALTILQQVMDPLAIQMGIVSPGNIYEAKRGVLKAFGVKETGRFITAPPEHSTILSPQEEVQRLVRGMEVPVELQQDHEAFVKYWEFLKSRDDILTQFPEGSEIVLERQSQQHQAMAQALQQATAQAANTQQIATNAQLSTGSGPQTGFGGQGGNQGPQT